MELDQGLRFLALDWWKSHEPIRRGFVLSL
jgi:hypothetical protein